MVSATSKHVPHQRTATTLRLATHQHVLTQPAAITAPNPTALLATTILHAPRLSSAPRPLVIEMAAEQCLAPRLRTAALPVNAHLLALIALVEPTVPRLIAPDVVSSPSASATQLVPSKFALPEDAIQLLALHLPLLIAATPVDAHLHALIALVAQIVHSRIAAFAANSRRAIPPLTVHREHAHLKDALQLLALHLPQPIVATPVDAHQSVITRPVAQTVQGLIVAFAANSRPVIPLLTVRRELAPLKDVLPLNARHPRQPTVATLVDVTLPV